MNKGSTPSLQTESAAVRSVCDWLTAHGYRVRREVSLLGQSVDVVATRGRHVTVVEVKIAGWRRTALQARSHELVADYILLAVQTPRVMPRTLRSLSATGYGLVRIEPRTLNCTLLVPPRRNLRIWKPQRLHWAHSLRNVPYGY